MTDREEWLAQRRRTVGGSEIASLFYAWQLSHGQVAYLHMFEVPPPGATMLGCVSRHTTGFRLWAQKSGRLEADDVDSERVNAGLHLESAAAEWAMRKWDWHLRKVHRYIVHPEIPGLGASRDYEEVAAGYPPVEIKNVDFLIFRDQWQADGDVILAPPMDLTLQVQHQIAGTRAPHGWIVACVGGNNLKRGMIPRHEPTIARIETAVREFWRAVDEGQAPYDFADYDTVADLFAVGEKAKVADLTRDNQAPELAREFLELKAQAAGIEKRMDEIKAALAYKIGDATRAKLNGFSITWPSIARPEKLIPEKVQPALVYRGGFTVKESNT